MKQLLILSGKGGTGKTTISGAFIRLSQAKAVADCDVDAPNLHLVLSRTDVPQTTDFMGMPKAKIDLARCTACGKCKETCRFDAISDATGFVVNPYACEGCGVCVAVCPADAAALHPYKSGELRLYQENEPLFSTAQLKMGSGNSGLLVTSVKKQLRTVVNTAELAILDGSPGIGCPVIASISGVDMVLLVTEPSASGISDLRRIIKTAQGLGAAICVCTNRYDVHIQRADEIEQVCKELDVPFVGRIPFDPEAVKAINKGITLADVDCPAGIAIRAVYEKTMYQLGLS